MYSVGQVCKHTDYLTLYEQKGVDNPERFLNAEVNENEEQPSFPRSGVNMQGGGNVANPENQLSNLPPQNLPQPQQNYDMNTLALLLGIMQQINKEKGDKAKPDDFIKIIEQIIEQEKNNEV